MNDTVTPLRPTWRHSKWWTTSSVNMTTSSRGNAFAVTGTTAGGFLSQRASKLALIVSLILIYTNGQTNSRVASDLSSHDTHCYVAEMSCSIWSGSCNRLQRHAHPLQWRHMSTIVYQVTGNSTIQSCSALPLLGECTGLQWTPLTKGQEYGNVTMYFFSSLSMSLCRWIIHIFIYN